MSDTIGRISVPALVDSGLTFPLTSDFGYGFGQGRPVVVHQFGELDANAEQRYAVGLGPRRFAFRRQHLSMRDRASLVSFWEGLQGAWKSFTYKRPKSRSIHYAHEGHLGVRAARDPIPRQRLPDRLQFPRSTRSDRRAQLCGEQHLYAVPVHRAPVRPTLAGPADHPLGPHPRARIRSARHLLSDRRVTVGGQLYLPRVLGIGEPGSDVILSQDIKATADNVQFNFGNPDCVNSWRTTPI